MYTILIHIRRNILVINLTTRYIYNVAVLTVFTPVFSHLFSFDDE